MAKEPRGQTQCVNGSEIGAHAEIKKSFVSHQKLNTQELQT